MGFNFRLYLLQKERYSFFFSIYTIFNMYTFSWLTHPITYLPFGVAIIGSEYFGRNIAVTYLLIILAIGDRFRDLLRSFTSVIQSVIGAFGQLDQLRLNKFKRELEPCAKETHKRSLPTHTSTISSFKPFKRQVKNSWASSCWPIVNVELFWITASMLYM